MSKKSKTKTQETTSGTQTVTRQNPKWLTGPSQQYAGMLSTLMGTDPGQYTVGPSDLQNQAFDAISNRNNRAQVDLSGILGGQRRGTPNYVKSEVSQTPSIFAPQMDGSVRPISNEPRIEFAENRPQNRPQLASTPVSGVNGFDLAEMLTGRVAGSGANTAASVGGYNPASAGRTVMDAPTQATGQDYQASLGEPVKLGGAQGYDAPTVSETRFNPAARAASVQTAAAPQVNYQSILNGIKDFENPYQDQVIDATMANYDDDIGRRRAAMAAQAAGNGAFGGSRYAIRESQFESDTARERADALANIRSQGFNTAAGLAAQDVANRQAVDMANANFTASRNAQQASLDAAREQFNAGAENSISLAQGQADQNRNLTQANLDATAGQFGANAANNANLQQGDMDLRSMLAGMDAENEAGRFNVSEANNMSQFNSNLLSEAARYQAGLDQQSRLADQSAINDASRFNLSTEQANRQFNAGQRDNFINRMLQVAGLLSDNATARGANERADLSQLLEAGVIQQAIAQQEAGAPLAFMSLLGELTGNLPYNAFGGTTATDNRTSRGISTTRESNPLGLAGTALSFFA